MHSEDYTAAYPCVRCPPKKHPYKLLRELTYDYKKWSGRFGGNKGKRRDARSATKEGKLCVDFDNSIFPIVF